MSITLRNLPNRYIWAGVISLILLAVLGALYWKNSQRLVRLRPQGKAIFIRGGFFRQDEFNLTKDGRSWRFDGSELILPFECSYNQFRTLRLENDGRVYLLDKSSMERIELRVVNGEWSYDASSHWQAIFDLEKLPLEP